MFKIVRCRGVLLKAMNRNIQGMAILSFFFLPIPLTIICITTLESAISIVSSGLLFWYIVSLLSLGFINYENGNLRKIFTLPVFLSLKISVLIFKFFLKKKYPEMEEEHYQRWIKLQRIQKQIKRK